MQEEPFPSEKIFNLDSQAKRLGIGGKVSPEINESLYKEKMQRRKDTVSYTHLTLPTNREV